MVDVRRRLTADLTDAVVAVKHGLPSLRRQLPLSFVVSASQDMGNAHLDCIPHERVLDAIIAKDSPTVVDELENLTAFVGAIDTRLASQGDLRPTLNAFHSQRWRHASSPPCLTFQSSISSGRR